NRMGYPHNRFGLLRNRSEYLHRGQHHPSVGWTAKRRARRFLPSARSNNLKDRRYVLMANGHGMRWGKHLGIPKHLISVDDETLIQRIVRQVRERDPNSDVVISSSNPLLETPGARRHAPQRNEIELDRFAPELVND